MSMLPHSRPAIVLACVAVSSAMFFAGCTPYVYKDDIALFSKGVDESATAFDALRAKMLARYTRQELEELAENKAVVSVSADCTDTIHKQLPADTRCLAAWANYRAIPEAKRGPKPACRGASESVRTGEYSFYDLDAVAGKEAVACKLGIKKEGGGINTAAIDNAEVWVTNAPKLLPALQGYATALAGIADSSDREALRESIGKAKDEVVKLGTTIDGLEGKTSPYVAAIGPVSDLVGTALVLILDQRRYQALKDVTAGADPVVARAAMILSNVAMPMTAIELQDAGDAYFQSVLDAGKPAADADAWIKAYEKAREARADYLAVFATSPTSVFKAMAEAHHQLTLALVDPNRQYESVKAAVEDFADKAKSAYDAVQKAKKTD